MEEYLKFTKMHALGNDFMVISALDRPFNLTPREISKLADRHRGIGFDQLLLITQPFFTHADFGLRIFNANGKEVFQCGNGLRCVARFINQNNLCQQRTLIIATQKKTYEAILVDDHSVNVNMQKPFFAPADIPFKTEKNLSRIVNYPIEDFSINALSMGNPHCVLILDTLDQYDIDSVGKKLSTHPDFPEQTNVEFMRILDPKNIELRIYERGVGETQACGSGACAAVVIGRLQNLLAETVRVHMPGGSLEINWQHEHADVWMKGEAIRIFDGEINLAAWDVE